jgi:hypothetical protein
MTALALLGNYVLIGFPNVELGSVVIFITSLLFGISMGLASALLSSIIFASFNPWGPFIPQIWIAQVVGWVYIAAVGGLLRTKDLHVYQGRTKMFLYGAYLTLIFDLVTNIGYTLVYNVPYIVANILGLPFMVVHVLSNAFIMAIVVPIVEPIVKMDLGPMIWMEEGAEYEIGELEISKETR